MRTHAIRNRRASVVLLAGLLLAAGCAQAPEGPAGKISRFGEYSGYSAAAYDGWDRHSVYVPMPDGTRIAVDYFLPTAGGREASEPLPVVLHYTRYIRATVDGDRVVSRVDGSSILQELLRHGYAVAVADAPGTGASFGVHQVEFSVEETAYSYHIIEWLAAQSWCDGNVGMQGASYPGMTQYQAATQAPPHLRAIVPEVAGPTPYDFCYRGGTYKQDFIEQWGSMTRRLDLGLEAVAAPVDSDADGAMRDAAVAEHAANLWAPELAEVARYRDWTRTLPGGRLTSWANLSTIDDVARIDASGVAIYHVLGWYDIYTTQQAMMFANLNKTPQKMMIGPWTHSGRSAEVYTAELLRWYDHWLKGIGNGVMDEPPVHYWVMRGNNTIPEVGGETVNQDQDRANDGAGWATAGVWPPPGVRSTTYYFAAGPSGTVASINDGSLVPDRPEAAEGRDTYTVDFTCTSGQFNRWRNGYGARRSASDRTTFFDERTPEDSKALTYTSAPMEQELVLVGYPVVHLWVTSTERDGDFFAYLEEVDSEGRSHYVTEGALRASYRALAEPSYDTFALPYHPSTQGSLVELTDEPVELVFDLEGTAIVIDAGHRIRITVTGADADNFELYPDPAGGAPTVAVHRGSAHPSRIDLPVLDSR